MASIVVALRTGQTVLGVLVGDAEGSPATVLALAPLAWLMAMISACSGGRRLLFACPLYTIRLGYQRFVEMREMFTQTIGALASAVDKRDPMTSKHSIRVKEISIDIGRVMRVSDSELEALEWGGLLHDVGKIGVPDAILRKPEKLTKEERMTMNAHPVLGRTSSRRSPSLRRNCRSSGTITSGTTARATRTGSSATRSRSWPASSMSPMRSRR